MQQIKQRLKTLDGLDALLWAVLKAGDWLIPKTDDPRGLAAILGRAYALALNIDQERRAIFFAIDMTAQRRKSPWSI